MATATLGRWEEATRLAEASSRLQGDLTTPGWAPAWWLRDRVLPTLARASWLERRSALLTAGFNPAEQQLLSLGP